MSIPSIGLTLSIKYQPHSALLLPQGLMTHPHRPLLDPSPAADPKFLIPIPSRSTAVSIATGMCFVYMQWSGWDGCFGERGNESPWGNTGLRPRRVKGEQRLGNPVIPWKTTPILHSLSNTQPVPVGFLSSYD